MQKTAFWVILGLICNYCAPIQAQFDAHHLEIRLGYNVTNSPAGHYNALINQFNNRRYPTEISENLGNINFLKGMSFGANYRLPKDVFIHAIFKNRQQFLQTKYVKGGFRGYLFQSSTLELGLSGVIQEEKWFRHLGGAGLLLGNIAAYTQYSPVRGNPGARNMVNIDNSFLIGLSLNYEVQFWFTHSLCLYLRPVIQYSLPASLRDLDAFLNPVERDGSYQYIPTSQSKFNNGGLNGIGIEGGIIISPFHGR